jgi:hypothetical protein
MWIYRRKKGRGTFRFREARGEDGHGDFKKEEEL